MPSHEKSANPPRIPARHRPEIRINIGNQLLHQKIFPVPCHWRIHLPRTPERRSHVRTSQNEFPIAPSPIARSKTALCTVGVENRAKAPVRRTRQEINHGRPSRRLVVPRRQIHHHLAHRIRPTLVLRETLRPNLPFDNLPFRRLRTPSPRTPQSNPSQQSLASSFSHKNLPRRFPDSPN